MVFVTGRYCLKQIILAEGRNLPLRVSTSYRMSSVGPWSNDAAEPFLTYLKRPLPDVRRVLLSAARSSPKASALRHRMVNPVLFPPTDYWLRVTDGNVARSIFIVGHEMEASRGPTRITGPRHP
jgi:hypothetical protein